MTQYNICLASESPQRIIILRKLGIPFCTVRPEIEEIESANPYFSQTAFENSFRKALSVSEKYPDLPVLGADTVIEFQNRSVGKPRSSKHALEMLMSFSGKTHCVLTAVTIILRKKSTKCVFGDTTEVKMRNFTVETAKEYVGKVNVLGKAGAYAIQEHGDMLIESINGSFTNVVGLPKEKLLVALHHVFGNSCRKV